MPERNQEPETDEHYDTYPARSFPQVDESDPRITRENGTPVDVRETGFGDPQTDLSGADEPQSSLSGTRPADVVQNGGKSNASSSIGRLLDTSSAPKIAKEIGEAADKFGEVWAVDAPSWLSALPVKEGKINSHYKRGEFKISQAQPRNHTVHEVLHYTHDMLGEFGFEKNHKWRPEKPPTKKEGETSGQTRRREQAEAVFHLWQAMEKTTSGKALRRAMKTRKPHEDLLYLAEPREIFARAVEYATSHLGGWERPNYGWFDRYTRLTSEEIHTISHVEKFV